MKTYLKSALASVALLVCLGLGNTALAAENAPQPATQAKVEAQQGVIGPLAWQRVGSPISLAS